MKLIKTSGLLGLVALAVTAGPLAIAQDAGWYGGVSGGRSRANIDDARITSTLLGSGFRSVTIDEDNAGNGYKIFGGYQLNKNLALEGGYFDLGQFGFTATTVPAGTLNGTIKLRGLNLDAVGLLPITEKFSALGRIGINYAQARDTFSGTGAVFSANGNPTKRDTNLKVGLGLQYAFTESLSVRAELERYRINDAVGNKGDVDLASIGLVYYFGAKTPPPVARAAEPTRMAYVAPEPRPVIVPPPPVAPPVAVFVPPPPPPAAPAPTKVTLAADSLFEFDKSAVTSSGKQALDKLAADLKSVSYDTVSVVGHTDRIGSQAYNQKLSERRAQAVGSYLVQSGGVPSAKLVTRGASSSDPVTKPGDCPGKKVTQALKTCLQPDRRVEIEVVGTK